jgi:hypothetical protein
MGEILSSYFELLQHLGRDAVFMINFKGGERGDL